MLPNYTITQSALKGRLVVLGASTLAITSAFAPNAWLNLSVIGVSILSAVSLGALLAGGMRRLRLDAHVLFACLLVLQVLAAAVLSPAISEEKLLNHTSARLFSIVFIFLLPYILLSSERSAAKAFQVGVTISLCLCFALLLYDYARVSGLLALSPVPHIGSLDDLDATIRGFIMRARGGNYEPGHDAAAFVAAIPLALAFVPAKARIVVVIFFCMAVYLIGYSAALIFWLAIFLAVYSFLEQVHNLRRTLAPLLKTLLGLGAAALLLNYFEVFGDLEDKIFSASYTHRVESFEEILTGSIKDWRTFLFGYGPGGYLTLDVTLVANTYAGFLLDLGALGLVLYVAMIIAALNQLRKIGNPLYTAAFIAYALVFLNSIGNYWYPLQWLLLSYPTFALLDKRKVANLPNQYLNVAPAPLSFRG